MSADITILGLGPGDPSLLTREAWQVLESAREIYLRTARHPTVQGLPIGLIVHTFDHLYEKTSDYSGVYAAIAEEVLALAVRPEGVIYAVPGHPLVGEATTARILGEAPARGLTVRLVHGLSFVEPCLALLGLDPLDGLFIADALEVAALHHPNFHPDGPALIAQLYPAALASDVKLCLMNQYPDDHGVTLIHQAGTPEAFLERLPLFELDRSERIGHLTTLFVPPLPQVSSLEAFQATIARLRAPDGCPWDREQTHQSLRTNLLEESYEVLSALDRDDPQAMREEFGDLLLQIVLQSQIAVEAGEFSLAEVIASINAKIIRRHPHVFGDLKVEGVEQVLDNWEHWKAQEREEAGAGPRGLLDGVPAALPALSLAHTYQRRAVHAGFDWPDIAGVVGKIHEELGEVESASGQQNREAEVGDLLFSIVNYARWLKVDPEVALRGAARKFRLRFERIEAEAARQGRKLAEMSLEELDSLWEGVGKG